MAVIGESGSGKTTLARIDHTADGGDKRSIFLEEENITQQKDTI